MAALFLVAAGAGFLIAKKRRDVCKMESDALAMQQVETYDIPQYQRRNIGFGPAELRGIVETGMHERRELPSADH